MNPDTYSEHEDRFMHFLARVLPEFVKPQDLEKFVAAIAPGIKEYADAEAAEAGREGALAGTEACLKANFGQTMGQALFDLLTGRASQSNAELVQGKVTRAAVSKAACRLRRGYGLQIEYDKQARAGRAAGASKSANPVSP